MKGVQEILEFLGYGEIRLESGGPNDPEESEAGGEWAPLSDVNGWLGTTDETEILRRKESPTARLVDGETGELVATARKSCPIDSERMES